MSRQEVDIGVVGNDGTGDSIREAFRKVNDNFKEIYAVFNQGDKIGLQDLGDVTINNPNTILTTIDTGSGIRFVDRILDGGSSISVDFDNDRINIRAIGTSLDSDEKPSLAGPLNGNGFTIANTAPPNQISVNTFNDIHPDSPITINDIVITKGYGDQNYIRKTGGSSSISGQIRVRDEPININEYTLEVTANNNNNAVVTAHGFDSAFDGASYVYYSGGVPAGTLIPLIDVTNTIHFIIGRSFRIEELGNTNFTSLGALRNSVGEIFNLTNTNSITLSSTGKVKPVYFLKYVNANELSIHPTFNDAINGTNKINFIGGSGFQRFRDAYYDINLDGNWLSNEVLPRKSVLRRQGDTMDGPLMLHDHPFPLEGIGAPNRPDDLQAATKYYVDNSSFSSQVNLHVSTVGNDVQSDTPPGKEGRAWAYAFRSVGKACEVAEHLMNNAEFEPGPYRQLISVSTTVNNITNTNLSVITNYTPPSITGLARIKFTNNGGSPVDQGAIPTVEIIAGKIVRGRLSGATGIIYNYATDNSSVYGEDYVDLQQVKGEFFIGENLEFGDPVKNLHITIHIESGIYEEDYPIKLPANTAIVGDEFRRVLIRPKDRISRSPWVYTWFFRNSQFDGLNIINGGTDFEANLVGWYGYHYLKKPNLPINRGPTYTNIGGYTSESTLIKNARSNIQNEIVDYIESLGPVLTDSDRSKCLRDVGYIVDAIVYDLEIGGIDKIFEMQEIFSSSNLNANCKLGLNYIDNYINSDIITSSSTTVKSIITNMINKIIFGFNASYNTPKNNKDIDVFLCNDASIVRQVTCQGHGGFMMVLDPNGQILSKSPYCQQSGSFSASINKQSFRGGQYVDGFSGNLTATITQKISSTRLKISGVPREPMMPTSFFMNGSRYKVDSWIPEDGADTNARDLLIVNKLFIEAQTLSYLASTYTTIKYPESELQRHINRLIDAITFDVTLGGNSKTCDANRRFFDPSTESLLYPNNIKPLLIGMLDYIKDTSAAIIINQTVTSNQNKITQVKIVSRSGTFASQGAIVDLIGEVKKAINQGIDYFNNNNPPVNPTFVLVLDSDNPIATNPIKITLVTPGNTSMLSNDFTQVNDLGYGIVTNNNGLCECVSVFSYYCWASMFSNNGGQIRSLNSSTANGEYGLVAAGSDPLEIADQVFLSDDTIQVAKIVKRNTGTNDLSNTGLEKGLFIYVDNYQYIPYNISIIEINHGNTIGIVRYEMNNIQTVEPGVIRLNFNTAGNNDTSTGGLSASVSDGQKIIIRGGQNFKFDNVIDTNPTRPSTALTFEGDPANDSTAPVYRVISYNIKSPDNQSLDPDQAILTFDSTYNYVPVIVNKDKLITVDPDNVSKTLGNNAGDLKIAIRLITSLISITRLKTGDMLIAWDGKIHRILDYTAVTADNYGYLTISDEDKSGNTLQNINSPIISGLQSSLNPSINLSLRTDSDLVLRAGLAKDEPANITVRISTMRATGHDFLDVGTGGYNTSNYPSKIYGSPKDPRQANEVDERTRGRVFYVSTDQDGFFRVGRFFTVDQGTGTVTFAASIALSNLDGIGFKRGISIAEFSSDDKFVDLAEDTVPTEAAISGYIDRRLGQDRLGNNLADTERFLDSPGYLALNASTANKGPRTNISWNNKKLIQLANPTAGTDAANKDYVDVTVDEYSKLKQLKDVYTSKSTPGSILMFTSSSGEAVPSSITGDIQSNLTSNIKSTLVTAIAQSGGLTAIEINDASLFPDEGYVLIDQEIFKYSSRTTGSGAEQLDAVVRLGALVPPFDDVKFSGTKMAGHAQDAMVYSLDSAQIDLQIKPDTITNSDIKSNAAIIQSKLLLNLASTAPSAPLGTAQSKQAASGLSSFSNSNFEIIDGWVKIKDGGIRRFEQENLSTNRLLGNLTNQITYPQEVTPESVLKRATWDSIGATSTIGQDHVFTFRPSSTEATSTFNTTVISTNVLANSIAKRTSTGNLKITSLDSNGNVSIISISGTVILSGVTYAGNGVFNCNPTILIEGSRININGTNAGDLVLPNYSTSGTNYFIIATNGSTSFTLSRLLGGDPISTTGSSISGLTFINAAGTADNATPVTYKGQWSPGSNANFVATDLQGGVNGAVAYQNNVDSTSFVGPNISTIKKLFTQVGTGTAPEKPSWSKIQVSIPASRIAAALGITSYVNSTLICDVFLFSTSLQITAYDTSVIDINLVNETNLSILLNDGVGVTIITSAFNNFSITTNSGGTVYVPITL